MNKAFKRRDFLRTLGWGAASLSLASMSQTCKKEKIAEQRLPNIVLIFIDDMGYADVGCFGAKGYATPNIDGLAEQGMRFTSFYVAQAVCSASRAALLTGCYPNRVSIYGAYNDQAKVGINPEEEIIAVLERLNQKGITIIMVTHEREIAEHARRIIQMRDGQIVSDERIDKTFPQPLSQKDTVTVSDVLSHTHSASGGIEPPRQYPSSGEYPGCHRSQGLVGQLQHRNAA